MMYDVSTRKPAIPTIPLCLELMESYDMWENIRHHSFQVARVAALLQHHLEELGCRLDRDLVIAGALLHDIAKSRCLKEGCRHAEVGAELCSQLGYPEVAEIVANHVVLGEFAPDRYQRGVFNAIEVVFYADKRVRHDEVVCLDARLEYILDKYADDARANEPLIRENFSACQRLEHHLFSQLPFAHDELTLRLAHHPLPELHYPPTTTSSSVS